jgi:hypothetical protein
MATSVVVRWGPRWVRKLRKYRVGLIEVGRALRPGLVRGGPSLVVPAVVIAMPPTAPRAFTVPCPEAPLRPCRAACDASVPAHVMPTAFVARADVSSDSGRDTVSLRRGGFQRRRTSRCGAQGRKGTCGEDRSHRGRSLRLLYGVVERALYVDVPARPLATIARTDLLDKSEGSRVGAVRQLTTRGTGHAGNEETRAQAFL